MGIFTAEAGALSFAYIRLWHVELFEFMPCSYEVTASGMRGMGWSVLPTIVVIVQRRNHRLWIFTGLDSYFVGIPAVLQGYFEDEGNEQSPHHRFRRNDCYRHHKCCVLRRAFVPCRHLRHCAGCCLYCPNERQDKRTAPIKRTRIERTTVTTFRRIFSWH